MRSREYFGFVNTSGANVELRHGVRRVGSGDRVYNIRSISCCAIRDLEIERLDQSGVEGHPQRYPLEFLA